MGIVFNRYVLALFLSVLASGVSLFLVMNRLDPDTDEKIAVTLFLISLFLLSSSLTSLLGYLIRVLFYRSELFLNHFNVSLRQGVLIGLGVMGMFGLQIMRTLTWWNGLMLIIICFFIELYCIAKE